VYSEFLTTSHPWPLRLSQEERSGLPRTVKGTGESRWSLRTRRRAAIMAVTLAVELASARSAISLAAAAPGLVAEVTVSVDGATGMWAPDQPQPTSAASEATSASTAPVEEPSSPSEP
jgi:hypothetical protein